MKTPRVVIVGGGLAGLSAGCYARASGFDTLIVEHNLALGGVCTAWGRGPYTVDGCIHWLTGGAFTRVYDELGITARVPLHTLENFATWRDVGDGTEVRITRDLAALASTLTAISPADGDEIASLVEACERFTEMTPPVERPRELATIRDSLSSLWEMRHQLGTLVHYRKPLGEWAREHLVSPQLRRLFSRLAPVDAPAIVLAFELGYLGRGWLSRPEGGTARFRDALVDEYHRLGGEERLHATVDEILVRGDRAVGVRLADGSMLDADVVVSTSSTPETILRLLAGRYGAPAMRKRLERWKLFDPIVLASYGIATPLDGQPQMLFLDGIERISVGGRDNDHLYLRIYNDDPSFAPTGHTVVQALLATDYEWWATRGTSYTAEKDRVGEQVLARIDRHLPGVRDAATVTDVATPLTYWNLARSWRGAFEGWQPSAESIFGHVDKTLPGLRGFYLAGQWVEPGGGVPTALTSGRQAIQLACADERRPFVPGRGERHDV